jgi:hypothetical protein
VVATSHKRGEKEKSKTKRKANQILKKFLSLKSIFKTIKKRKNKNKLARMAKNKDRKFKA